ncbi:PadR family transcriptional regulator [Spiractinospora alimapuensis]|uniref:PadR family transcriptional regulator n=1 Tax=Spiractinospora alimapuensis TaxID=2820884 RepID=UPI001F2F29B3|nr:PadR family transcriptional regulator [Spiractinospora alimapuensis]QVQ50126.1 PadR family transcriptional regulator [Spiractinospora alimapuensis]
MGAATRGRKRSGLAVQLLLLLVEAPMHAYRMQQLIRERNKDEVVNIAQRNSIYQTLDRLARDELITVLDTERQHNRPDRTIYSITPEGRDVLHDWLGTMLSTPAREFPEFPVALASLPALEPREVEDFLRTRVEHLDGELARFDAERAATQTMGLPRLFTLEDEYRRAVLETERHWVAGVLEDLAEGRLTWSGEWLRAVAEAQDASHPQGTPNAPDDTSVTDGR